MYFLFLFLNVTMFGVCACVCFPFDSTLGPAQHRGPNHPGHQNSHGRQIPHSNDVAGSAGIVGSPRLGKEILTGFFPRKDAIVVRKDAGGSGSGVVRGGGRGGGVFRDLW